MQEVGFSLKSLERIPFEKPERKDRSLNPTQVDKFFEYNEQLWKDSGRRIEVMDLLHAIIDKTMYIDFETFWHNLVQSWKMFELYVEDHSFYLVIDGNKIGSETWIMQGLSGRILSMPNYKGLLRSTETYDAEVYENTIFVTIDDMIYTGIHTYEDVFGQFINNSGLENSDFIAAAITPYYTWDGVASCSDALRDKGYAEFKHFGIERIDPIEIAETDPPTIQKPYLEVYDFQFPMLYPIYFDHKVAGSSSSFPSIYLNSPVGSLLKNPPDRNPVERLAKRLQEK